MLILLSNVNLFNFPLPSNVLSSNSYLFILKELNEHFFGLPLILGHLVVSSIFLSPLERDVRFK